MIRGDLYMNFSTSLPRFVVDYRPPTESSLPVAVSTRTDKQGANDEPTE